MHFRHIPRTDLSISRLTYGGWALAKKGWKGVNIQEAITALHRAVELGVNCIDTAPVYGFGASEEIVGRELKHCRKKLILATKCGLEWDNRGRVRHDLSSGAVTRGLKESLVRLQTEYIDLYQVHWPDPATPLEQTCEALSSLQQKGYIRYIGLCNFPLHLVQKAREYIDIVAVQYCYNYLQREVEAAVLPYCGQHDLAFLAYSPLAQGLLTPAVDAGYSFARSDVRRLNPLFSNQALFEEALRKKAALGSDPVRESLFFLLHNRHVTSFLLSMTKISHVNMNIDLITSFLQHDEVSG
jgi:aryl-alcohol dehydrogenase-like predicted oxidoreductase